jgi:hypothetical protein
MESRLDGQGPACVGTDIDGWRLEMKVGASRRAGRRWALALRLLDACAPGQAGPSMKIRRFGLR